jgi:hypothetical protein
MSRKSAPDDTGKNLNELITMSVSVPSGKWNLIDIPCGLARGEPSGRLGIPVESEKRTVTGIGLPVKIIALLRRAASGVA